MKDEEEERDVEGARTGKPEARAGRVPLEGPYSTSSNDGAAVESLKELLNQQDEKMRKLFAKAINLFVAPGVAETVDREKVDRLRKAVDDSLT